MLPTAAFCFPRSSLLAPCSLLAFANTTTIAVFCTLSNTIMWSEALVGNYNPRLDKRTSVGASQTTTGPNDPNGAPQRLLNPGPPSA